MSIPLLLPLIFGPLTAQQAIPALETVASATAVNGEVYFRPGDLLLGDPNLPGRPAIRPLQGNAAFMLPSDLSDYETLSGACPRSRDEARDVQARANAASATIARGDIGGDGVIEVATLERRGDPAAAWVQVTRAGKRLAEAQLPVPAWPCTGLVSEVDSDAIPDLVVVWSTWGADGRTIGVTVYKLPSAP